MVSDIFRSAKTCFISAYGFPVLILALSLFVAFSILSVPLQANGINRNGVGARGIAMGGASNADQGDAFASMAVNPALLSYVDGYDLSVSLIGGIAEGRYENGSAIPGYLDDRAGLFPEIVMRGNLNPDLGFGLSLIPEQTRVADWVILDPAGGVDGNTSYGRRGHHSEIFAVRAAAGLGWKVSDTLSLGISGGAVYNRNALDSPYLFQSHPVLSGFKTLLDLETEGVGINGDLGLTWRPREEVTFGLSYRTATRIRTEGNAKGDIGRQLQSLGLAGVPPTFHYDAEVENKLPQVATGGVSWQVTDRTRIAFQLDWIGWSDAFDTLTVDLANGSNSSINDLLKSDRLSDRVPLDWEDRFAYRLGVDHQLAGPLSLRAGYAYSRSPIPTATLLPMTGAISEHTVGLGVGYHWREYEIDLSYQIDLPATARSSDSRILSGEFRDGRIDLESHWIAVTVRHEF